MYNEKVQIFKQEKKKTEKVSFWFLKIYYLSLLKVKKMLKLPFRNIVHKIFQKSKFTNSYFLMNSRIPRKQ